MTAQQELEAVAAERGSDIDDDGANLQVLVLSGRARLYVEPCQMQRRNHHAIAVRCERTFSETLAHWR